MCGQCWGLSWWAVPCLSGCSAKGHEERPELYLERDLVLYTASCAACLIHVIHRGSSHSLILGDDGA